MDAQKGNKMRFALTLGLYFSMGGHFQVKYFSLMCKAIIVDMNLTHSSKFFWMVWAQISLKVGKYSIFPIFASLFRLSRKIWRKTENGFWKTTMYIFHNKKKTHVTLVYLREKGHWNQENIQFISAFRLKLFSRKKGVCVEWVWIS